ncbi:hypothetical protein, partial [Escherichia coli]|uniref:hypothetical protein n=1 Tax=Escherichia coli TaxID=562 RepID=UPI001F18BB7A
LLLCHGTVCVVGKMHDLILQLSKSSIYSTKPFLQSSYPTNLKKALYRCGFKNLLFKKLIVHIVTSQYKQWREHRYLSLLAVLCMESVIG